MLTEEKLQSFKHIIHQSSRDEILWMSGFLAGLSENNVNATTPAHDETAAIEKTAVSILYGTETGNSKKVSAKLAAALKSKKYKVTITALDQYNISNFQKEHVVVIVMSTHGDGEPPVVAKKFYHFLHEKAHDFKNVHYAVLALGDSSYPLFCKAGEDVDARLQQSGAKQIIPVKKLDTDFDNHLEDWISNILSNLPALSNVQSTNVQHKQSIKKSKHFYNGKIIKHINLNDKGSKKETFHIEIGTGEAIRYSPGDSLGIVPFNTDEDVHEIIGLLSAYKNQTILYKDEVYTLFDLFKTKLNILYMPLRIIEKYAALIQAELPPVRLDLKNILALYPFSKDVLLDDFIAILEPITPRLYSISSSPAAHGKNEVHITVSRNKFSVNQKHKFGFCSNHVAFLNEGAEIKFYISQNNNLRLPQSDKNIIMIGPGTGIAPFRSFLFERDSEGATGNNWLFFGDQHFATDFLYQSELLSWFDTGSLTKINTAFSRDQKEKLYVQHRMQQQSKELFSWIKNGAHVYICGCKNTMAKDVEETLINIIGKEGKLDKREAEDYLNRLEEEGRYAKDVY